MENKYLIGLGAIALGMFAYSRYAKKDDSGQGEDPNTGGGGGGGGTFFPNIPTPPAPPAPPIPPIPPVIPARVIVTPTTRVAATTTQMNNPIQSGITRSGVSGTGINTGGITGAGTGTTSGGSGSGTGTGTTSGGSGVGGAGGYTYGGGGTGNPKKSGPATQQFSGGYGNLDGSAMNCKTPIYLNDLVRSWNRP